MTSPSEMKLLPCPFCGSNDINTEGPCYTQFMCNGCGAATYDQDSHAEAVTAWNRRPLPPQIEGPEVAAWEFEVDGLERYQVSTDDPAQLYEPEEILHLAPLIRLSDHSAIVEGLEKERDELRREAGELVVAQYAISAAEATILSLAKRLEYAAKGLDMVHNGLMDPTRPRQAVGEVCYHFLEATRAALHPSEPGGAK